MRSIFQLFDQIERDLFGFMNGQTDVYIIEDPFIDQNQYINVGGSQGVSKPIIEVLDDDSNKENKPLQIEYNEKWTKHSNIVMLNDKDLDKIIVNAVKTKKKK